MLILGIIAYLVSLAFARSVTIFEKALYAYTIYGSAITPCLVAALFWKGAAKWGAITSIVAGTIVTLLWSEAEGLHEVLPESIAALDAVLPAITISVLFLVGISLITRKR